MTLQEQLRIQEAIKQKLLKLFVLKKEIAENLLQVMLKKSGKKRVAKSITEEETKLRNNLQIVDLEIVVTEIDMVIVSNTETSEQKSKNHNIN
jgi:hypothetical protein